MQVTRKIVTLAQLVSVDCLGRQDFRFKINSGVKQVWMNRQLHRLLKSNAALVHDERDLKLNCSQDFWLQGFTLLFGCRLVCLMTLSIFFGFGSLVFSQEPAEADAQLHEAKMEDTFRLYRGDGKKVELEQMLLEINEADVIFIGESHDDPVAHYLQETLFRKLHSNQIALSAAVDDSPLTRQLILSLEMFERDVQFILDEYLDGLITEKHFVKAARCWSNYESDYRPLIEYAKEHGLSAVAANAPRRYVNLVGREGAVALQKIVRPFERGLPPLPYAGASEPYRGKFNALMEKFRKQRTEAGIDEKKKDSGAQEDGPLKSDKADDDSQEKPSDKTSGNADEKDSPEEIEDRARSRENSLQAQSLWDAAMAYTITEQLVRDPASQVLHICGSFHCERELGIPEHLLRYRSGTSLSVITILSDASFPEFDFDTMQGAGDFVFVTDASLPRSYDASAKSNPK